MFNHSKTIGNNDIPTVFKEMYTVGIEHFLLFYCDALLQLVSLHFIDVLWSDSS